ncbi:FmdB family zinc ribbon protein [Chenggangzhangella methanolivorans]|uniref:Zinc ribbon domain-containing protein n=1 Tax=Chenggangzhangella methanolivorans TaxID=1437009 RepID=A0A9E6R9B6_9HYPH|nr:zinc ribbon domain-containing protein [Chenggangzhangella methanolivorans]QZN99007.1 zinc ribbon domain-containing protein [Chenggangzhangella methanolivorans]
MPVYDYACDDCGTFTALRPMSAFDQPCGCPDCGAQAPRVMLVAPALATMNSARRIAAATNERSSNEPKSSKSHAPGCGCCSSRGLKQPSSAAKSFPKARPWMISH